MITVPEVTRKTSFNQPLGYSSSMSTSGRCGGDCDRRTPPLDLLPFLPLAATGSTTSFIGGGSSQPKDRKVNPGGGSYGCC